MAKKFVRGVTGVDNIENFDKSLTNVNDLISDGQATYVHTKKGKNEKYVNITDKITSITSGDTGLLDVSMTGDNNATITPKHDAQKEQSLESTRGTVSIQKGGNGTSETTKVDTNPQKVLEHDNLLTDYGISKTKSGNTLKLALEYTNVSDGFDLNNLTNGYVKGYNLTKAPQDNKWYYASSFGDNNYSIQEAILLNVPNTIYRRVRDNGVWQPWREQVGDKSIIDGLLAQKQNTLSPNTSIGVLSNNQLRQLFAFKNNYNHTNGLLKTHIKSLAENTSPNTPVEEFNFIVKINKGASSTSFTLNEYDKNKFANIMISYGENNTVRISGCVFTLSGSTLTVSTTNNTAQNYVITFSDII